MIVDAISVKTGKWVKIEVPDNVYPEEEPVIVEEPTAEDRLAALEDAFAELCEEMYNNG